MKLMIKRLKSPQEKKALSYAKDCRNTYGENDKSSRKNVALRKANINCAYRSKINAVLKVADGKVDLAETESIEHKVKIVKKDKWKKSPDMPLREFVERQLEKRINRVGSGKTARQEIDEIVSYFKFDIEQSEDSLWIAKVVGLEQFTGKADNAERAIEKVRYIAKAAIENALGFDVKILIDGNLIKPVLEAE